MNKNEIAPMVQYSSAEMAAVFNESFAHVLGNLGNEDMNEVLKYVVTILGENTFLIGAPEEFALFTDTFFKNEVARDFIFMLQRVFFGRWLQGRGEGLIRAMVYDLAVGMTITPIPQAEERDKLIPEQLAQTIPSVETAIALLSNNLWFVTVIMIPLFVNLTDIDSQISKK